jgi:hypothetical protein
MGREKGKRVVEGKSKRRTLARREFLQRSLLAATGSVLAGERGGWLGREAEAAAVRSRVVVVTADAAIREGHPDRAEATIVEKMLERGLCELAGKSDPQAAWRTFFRPSDAVATCDAGFHLQNVPELTVAVLKGLAFADVARMKLGSQYVSWYDRFPRRCEPWIRAVKEGLKVARISDQVMDPALYQIPARFAVEPFDALLVVCTLKPHYLCGVSGVVKHFCTLGKRGPREYHGNAMVTAGSVLTTDFSRHRKLVVVDALRFARTAKPHRSAEEYVYPKALILSTDPVAADTVALEMFRRNGCRPHGAISPRVHIEAADKRYHAGASDLARIEVRRVKI